MRHWTYTPRRGGKMLAREAAIRALAVDLMCQAVAELAEELKEVQRGE